MLCYVEQSDQFTSVFYVIKVNMIKILKVFLQVWDFWTFGLYLVLQRPWIITKERCKTKAKVTRLDSQRVVLETSEVKSKVSDFAKNANGVINNFVEMIGERYKDRKCFGYRKVLKRTEGTFNGKPVTKFIKSPAYEYLTYREVLQLTNKMAHAFIQDFDIKKGDQIFIFSNTRMEWMLSAFACLKAGGVVVTMVPIMSETALCQGLKQTQPKLIISEIDLLPKLLKVLKSSELSPPIICMDKVEDSQGFRITELSELTAASNAIVFPKVKPSDKAVIMYTSGTTSAAKGVILSHGAICNSFVNCLVSFDKQGLLDPHSNYSLICYLPLSHSLEFSTEFFHLAFGACLHFGSALTLTDNSPGVAAGQKGDISLAKPRFMMAVPLVLIKLKLGIEAKLSEKGKAFQDIVNFCIDYKLKWRDRGFKTPILDKLLFSKIRQSLGGNLGAIVVGGAAVPADVQRFLQAVVCDTVMHGYGCTEVTGPATVQDNISSTTGNVGIPCGCTRIMLESWEEVGYFTNDSQGPAGEILIGNSMVMDGYFPSDSSQLYLDDKGNKWFRTGDIGRINLDENSLSIIDRKKQMIKLNNGEYVALGKVDTCLTESKYIDMACCIAKTAKNGILAIVIPNQTNCQTLVDKAGNEEDLAKLILKAISFEMASVLSKHELPKAICCVEGPWTPENGLVTGALKIRRHKIEAHYQQEVDELLRQIV